VLENSAFLKALQKLFEANKGSGSVYVTFKQVVADEHKRKAKKDPQEKGDANKGEKGTQQVAQAPQQPTGEVKCLVRATDGKSGRKKTKISTYVRSKDLVGFQLGYNKILMANMDALKKEERKKQKKKKTAAQ